MLLQRADHDGSNPWNDDDCIEPGAAGFTDCPIVANGAVVSTPFPYEHADGAFQAAPLVITFTDDRGRNAPEPAARAMMLVGLGAMGAAHRISRRHPGPVQADR